MQQYIVRVIDDNDVSQVITDFGPGGPKLETSLVRSKALRFDDLTLAVDLRDCARKQFKSAWIVYADKLEDIPSLTYDDLGRLPQ